MTQADRYYESDEFRELLQRYETAQAEGRSIYLEPDEIADIAEYYQMLGNDVNATAAADYGLTIFPASAVLLAVRARLALIAGDISQARHYASLTDDTTSPDYHYITAEILIAEGKPDEADRYLTGILDSLYDDEREDFIIDATGIFADYQQWELAYRWLQLSTDFDAADYKELRGRIAMNRGNYEESERILRAAQAKGLLAKLHADEMSSTGGAGLACRLGAVSADHLLSISDADIGALGESKTVAVLLPATAFCMRKPYAPARRMMEAGAAVALASDYNPGSCYTYSVPLIFGLAVIAMHMTAAEALTAMTLNAAAAVGRAAAIGSIEPGKRADIVLLDAPDYRFLAYKTGLNLVERVYCGGVLSYQHP